ncbi:MAG: hypothetical protein IBX60_04405 [Candidatus Aminicenantes bacterium]|nr:hypothetical protein [Candidatus Aminicenantes bacterium]
MSLKIEFNKDQYEGLIKLVYLGNWMVNAYRIDDCLKEFEEIEEYVLSFSDEMGFGNYVVYDKKFKKHFPTRKFEEEVDVYVDEYNDEIFWDELIDRLAKREFINKYGQEAIRKMDLEERFEKLQPFINKYEREFEKYGIENLVIKK